MPLNYRIIAIDNDSLLILLKDKEVIISKRTAFIVDNTIIELIFKKDISFEDYENLEVLFNFMDCRDITNEYRQLMILPSLYEEIKERLKETKESLPLFRGHFSSARNILGIGEESDEEELISLAKHLETICIGVIIISQVSPNNEEFCKKTPKRTFVTNLEHIAKKLRLIPNFYNYLYKKYYDSSA